MATRDYPTRTKMDSKARGYDWLLSELRRVQDECRAEALRLLGPDRGE